MSQDRWDIIPYMGLGALHLGLTRSQVRTMVDGIPATFRQGPFAANVYAEFWLQLYYDAEDRLRCIIAFGKAPIHYKNVLLLDRHLLAVLNDLGSVGLNSRNDDAYWIDCAGFVLHAPDDVVRAVNIYGKGYFEEEVELASKGSVIRYTAMVAENRIR